MEDDKIISGPLVEILCIELKWHHYALIKDGDYIKYKISVNPSQVTLFAPNESMEREDTHEKIKGTCIILNQRHFTLTEYEEVKRLFKLAYQNL